MFPSMLSQIHVRDQFTRDGGRGLWKHVRNEGVNCARKRGSKKLARIINFDLRE